MKYLLAAASALLVASPALAHGPALGKRHQHRPNTGIHRHYHCHKRKNVCHWHKHSHWGKDAGHHGKWFLHHSYPNRYRYYDDYYWYPAPSWEIHIF